MNFPQDHELYLPTDPSAFLDAADVVLVVDSDVPWTPKRRQPSADATVIGVGPDPLFSRYPVRGFPVDVNLAGRSALTLAALDDAVATLSADQAVIESRRKQWATEHRRLRVANAERAAVSAPAAGGSATLDKAWFSACLQELRPADSILLSELGFDTAQLRFTEPGTYFGVSHAGVLGWGLGAALGAKLAAADRTVIACIGDGSYLFGAPAAAHWVSRQMNLPVLYLVWNNAQWGAVAGATRSVYPDGWAVQTNSFPFSDLSPSLDFELICRSAGGYGEKVTDPAELPGALERALHAVQVEGRQALLNLIAAPG